MSLKRSVSNSAAIAPQGYLTVRRTESRPKVKVFGILLASTLMVQSNAAVCAASNDLEMASANVAAPEKLAFDATLASIGASGLEVATPDMNETKVQAQVPAVADESNAVAPEKIAAASLPLGNATDAYSTGPLKATITSDPNEAMRRIDELTRQILLKEIELERFNLHYKLEVAKQGRWKGWRYGGLQIANNALGLSGGIVGTAERGSHLSTGVIHTSVQENANILVMVGSFIGASAAFLEFSINEYHDLAARDHGFAPKAARDKVNNLRAEIDRMLAERTALIAVEAGSSTLSGHSQVDVLEGKVFGDLRDQGLLEFERFHISARKLLAFQQSQYFFDFCKYTIGGMGAEFAFLALHKHRRKWNGKAGVMFMTAGGITMFGPIVSRYIAKGVGEMHKHYVHGTVQEAENAEVATLEKDEAAMDAFMKSGTVTPDMMKASLDRVSIYADQSKTFQDEVQSSSKTRSQAKLSATQNVGAGLYVGAAKIAQGVLFYNVGANRNFNSKTDRANKVTNANLFAASVVGLQASAFSLLDTLRINVQGEINRRKLDKSGMLPQQLVAARLAQLDEMEKRVRATP